MARSAKLTLYLFFLLCIGRSLNNYTTTTSGPNGEYIWQSTSNFVPKAATSYGTIKIGQKMTTEFDFYFKGRSNTPRTGYEENFFRVGHSKASGGCTDGSRYPSMWLVSGEGQSGHFDISVSAGSQCDLSTEITEYGDIPIGIWMHIIIVIDWETVRFTIFDGTTNYTESWNRVAITSRDHLGAEVPVWWMSDRPIGYIGYNIGDGILKNIVITSSVFTYSPTSVPTAPTSYPTAPTSNPTSAPTNPPTFDPTSAPTFDPTTAPTENPSVSSSTTPSLPPSSTQPQSTTLVNNIVFIGSSFTPTLAPSLMMLEKREDLLWLCLMYGMIGGFVVVACGLIIFCIVWHTRSKPKKLKRYRKNAMVF